MRNHAFCSQVHIQIATKPLRDRSPSFCGTLQFLSLFLYIWSYDYWHSVIGNQWPSILCQNNLWKVIFRTTNYDNGILEKPACVPILYCKIPKIVKTPWQEGFCTRFLDYIIGVPREWRSTYRAYYCIRYN